MNNQPNRNTPIPSIDPKFFTDDEHEVHFNSGANEYARFLATTQLMEDGKITTPLNGQYYMLPLATPIDAMDLATNNPRYTQGLEVAYSTAESSGAQMLLCYVNDKGEEVIECIRTCAMPSLISNVAGVKGNRWNEMLPENKAKAVNEFIPSAPNINMTTQHGKISRMVTDKYVDLPIPELLKIVETISNEMGEAVFANGMVNYWMTVCKFMYPKRAQEFTDAYRDTLALYGRMLAPGETLTPVLEFKSSDTTNNAATLQPGFQFSNGRYMPVGEAIRVNHVMPVEYDENGNRKTPMQKFEEAISDIFSRMKFDLTSMMEKMLNTEIQYAVNTFIWLGRKAQIPVKYGGIVEEELKQEYPNGTDCTFLDIYMDGLIRMLEIAQDDIKNPNAERMLTFVEAVARIANNPSLWLNGNHPGTVAWAQNVRNAN